jgi:hypothetical protein
LDSDQAVFELGHQVNVGTMGKREPDHCVLAGKPLHRGKLTDVALNAAVDRALPTMRGAGWWCSLHRKSIAADSDRNIHIRISIRLPEKISLCSTTV